VSRYRTGMRPVPHTVALACKGREVEQAALGKRCRTLASDGKSRGHDEPVPTLPMLLKMEKIGRGHVSFLACP